MLALVLASTLAGSLPPQPLPLAFQEGAALGRKGKDPGRLASLFGQRARPATEWEAAGDWAKPLGWWFNGKDLSPVEKVLWLSPSLLSRWMGWRSEREGWSPAEIQDRWDEARFALDGRSAFAVLLASYPKKGWPGITDDERQPLTDLGLVGIQLRVNGQRIPVMIENSAEWQSRTREGVENQPWWLSTPLAGSLGGASDPSPDLAFPLGDYRRRLVWIECSPIPEQSHVELTLHSAGRIRTASWGKSPRRNRL